MRHSTEITGTYKQMLVFMILVKGRKENEMMISCNRFALIPHSCLECKRYIWLEGYRRAKVMKKFIDICQQNYLLLLLN